ncbi:MAG: ABC transporter substrate-binding protein [Oscillospiraceae bacterium]|nr:ABC transporter substrate-binding protein [Oscillospiraceae bacterium]
MKKLMSAVLAMSMMFTLAACGGKTEDPANGTNSDKTETTGTYKFGGLGPLTGEAAIYGNAVKNGAQIAVDEINAKGGTQIQLMFQDDVADGETSINAYNKLLDDGMQVLVGPTTTGAALAVSAKAYENRVFCLTPSASSTDVIDGKDDMFQVCFTDPNQGSGSATYIAANMPGKKIAVIYRNDDAYSQGIRDTFVSQAATEGLDIVYQGTFTKDTATDFSVQLTAAQNAGADLVFMPIYYQPASVILTQAHQMGYAPTFFGVDGMDGILAMPGFDTTLAEGLMLLTPFSADAQDELTQNFVKTYEDKYGETPNQFAADAYDAVYILYQALEEANCTPDMSAEDVCEALVAVMPTITYSGLTGTDMTWDSTGAVTKMPTAVVIQNGEYVTANTDAAE